MKFSTTTDTDKARRYTTVGRAVAAIRRIKATGYTVTPIVGTIASGCYVVYFPSGYWLAK